MTKTNNVVERLRAVRVLPGTNDWPAQQSKPHALCLEAADLIQSLSDRIAELVDLADDLQQAEAEYRLMHDRHGDGSQAAGRAWDLMRRAGDKARASLKGAK